MMQMQDYQVSTLKDALRVPALILVMLVSALQTDRMARV
jgi:hypothetical protein